MYMQVQKCLCFMILDCIDMKRKGNHEKYNQLNKPLKPSPQSKNIITFYHLELYSPCNHYTDFWKRYYIGVHVLSGNVCLLLDRYVQIIV